MRILLWHVHGSWTTSFVHGLHEYVVPVLPGRGPDGVGIARTFAWPAGRVTEASPDELREMELDCVVLQRPHELEHLCEAWTGRRPGRDVPAIYLEHNAPQGRINELRHPAADRDDLLLVHVTHFNELFWDAGATPTRVIEHGIVDPGPRYTGELPRAVVVVNEARRRARVTGTDLLERFARAAPIDLFGWTRSPCGFPASRASTTRRRPRCTARWRAGGCTCIPSAGPRWGSRSWRRCTSACPWWRSGPRRWRRRARRGGAVSTDVGRLAARLRELVGDPTPPGPRAPPRVAPRSPATASSVF
jgi:hypothetical protein